jgi:hypothetical protein
MSVRVRPPAPISRTTQLLNADNYKTVIRLLPRPGRIAILPSAMIPQTNGPALRKLVLQLILLAVAATSASAQGPAEINDPVAALRSAKSIFVRSSSLLVGASVVEDKLQKRAEFSQMGLVITRDILSADIILELEHDVFTKYVYTAIDRKTNLVVASGKLSSLGGTVAGKVAKRFLKQVMQARGLKT